MLLAYCNYNDLYRDYKEPTDMVLVGAGMDDPLVRHRADLRSWTSAGASWLMFLSDGRSLAT